MLASEVRSLRTEELIALRAEVAKYSDDQPRDEAGRWTDGAAADRHSGEDALGRPLARLPSMSVEEFRGLKQAYFVRDESNKFKSQNSLQALAEIARLNSQIHAYQYKGKWLGPNPAIEAQRIGHAAEQSGAAVHLSEQFFGKDAQEFRDAGDNGGFHPAGTWTPAGVAAHEYGHWLDGLLTGANGWNYGLTPEQTDTYKAWREDLMRQPPISGYARTNDLERVAETFAAAFAYGSQATEEPQAAGMRDALDKMGLLVPVNKFDPSQPRDEAGRWTDGGAYEADQRSPGGEGSRWDPMTVAPPWKDLPSALTDLRSKYPETHFGDSLLKGLPDRTLPALAMFDHLKTAYPGVKVTGLEITDLPPGTDGRTTISPKNGTDAIHLGASVYVDGLDAWLTTPEARGWYVPGTANPAGTLAHEFGHVVMADAGFDAGWGKTTFAMDTLQEAFFQATPEDWAKVSGYAATAFWTGGEAFAEAFNAVANPDSTAKDSPIVSAMRDFLEATPSVRKFDPSQPRDEAGRWTADGGSAPGLSAVLAASLRPIDAAATADLHAHGYAGAMIEINGDPDMVQRTVKAYERLAEQFPKTAAAIRVITVHPPSLKVMEGMANAGIAATSADGRTVMINPYWMAHPDEYEKVNQQAIAAGWFTPGTAKLEGVIAHEFGHTIFAQEPGASELLIDLIVRGMTHDLGDYQPSGYAGTDAQEWWAEMVSQAINEPRDAQSVPVRAVGDYLQNLSELEKGSADIVKFDPSQPRDEAGRWTAAASEVGGLPGAAEWNDAQANRFVNYPANEYNGVQLSMHAGIHVWPSVLEQVRPDNFAALSGALLRLHGQFPDVKVTELEATPFSDPGTVAVAHRTLDGDAIWLSSHWWSGDLPTGAAGWHPEGTANATGYITHEFGHALDRNLLRATPGFIGSEVADSYRAWRQDFAADKARWPGGYGQTNVAEAMADLFAATYTPGAVREPESANLEQALAGNYKAAPEPTLQLSKFDESEPRDEAGRWTDGGSAAILDRLGMETVAPGARFKPEGIAPEYHPMIREVLKEFATRFPGIASRAGGVKVFASSQLAPDSQAETLGNTIRLSKTWYNLPASAWPTEEFTARFSVDPSARGTLVHELGHVVDADGGMADGSYYPSLDLYAQNAGWNVPNQEPISGYSTVSAEENFAESFAAWWDGKDTDSPQVVAMDGFIKDRYPDAVTKADTVSPLVFSDEMRKLLVEAYKDAFAAGWDDTDTETDLSDNTIDDMLDQEVPDLNQTITSLAALLIGGAVSGPMLVARLGQWAAALNSIYEKGFAGGVSTMGDVTRVTWVTEEDGIVCPLCDDRDGRTWLSGEHHPYPGEGYYGVVCEGGPHCRCSLTYELVAEVAEDEGDEGTYDEPYDTTEAAAVPDLTILSVPELLRMRAALKYSPDQPRDEAGRFAATDFAATERTPDEQAATQRYEFGGEEGVNTALRSGNADEIRAYGDTIRGLVSLTQRSFLPHEGVLYRGVPEPVARGILAEAKQNYGYVAHPEFTSTSIDPAAAERFAREQPEPGVRGALLRYHVAAGAPGAFLPEGGIGEVLMPRYTTWRVTGHSEEDGLLAIDLKVEKQAPDLTAYGTAELLALRAFAAA